MYLGPRDDESLLERFHSQRDVAARDELIARYLPVLRSLAKRYSTDEGGRFVNGVLAAAATELRRLGSRRAEAGFQPPRTNPPDIRSAITECCEPATV